MLEKGTQGNRHGIPTGRNHFGAANAPKVKTERGGRIKTAVSKYATHLRLLPKGVLVDGRCQMINIPCREPENTFDNESGNVGHLSVSRDNALTITTQVYNYSRNLIWVVDQKNVPLPVGAVPHLLKSNSMYRGHVVIRQTYTLPNSCAPSTIQIFESIMQLVESGDIYQIYDEFDGAIYKRQMSEAARTGIFDPSLNQNDIDYLKILASGTTLRKMAHNPASDQVALVQSYIRNKQMHYPGQELKFHIDYLIPDSDLMISEIFYHKGTNLMLLGNPHTVEEYHLNPTVHPGSYVAKLLAVRCKHWDYMFDLNSTLPTPNTLTQQQKDHMFISGISVIWHEVVDLYYTQNGCVYKIKTALAEEGEMMGVHFYNTSQAVQREDGSGRASEFAKNYYAHRNVTSLADLEKYGFFTTLSAAESGDYVKFLQHEIAKLKQTTELMKSEQEYRRSEQENIRLNNTMVLDNIRHETAVVKETTAQAKAQVEDEKIKHEKEILPKQHKHEERTLLLKDVALILGGFMVALKFGYDFWKSVSKA